MIELGDIVVLGASTLVGTGVGLLTYASVRRRTRAARSRRLAQVVGLDQSSPDVTERARSATWSAILQNGRRLSEVLIGHQVAATRIATLVALVAGLTGLLSGQLAWGPVGLAAVGLVTWLKRQSAGYRRLEQQAPAALEMLSAGLRAGYSVPQAIALVGRDSPEPTAAEFVAVGRELSVGSSLADSLTHLSERTGLADYTMVSTVIWIHGQVGGNLAVVLDAVVTTLRDRFDLREQVRALTAQQRMATTTLALLPVGILLLLMLIDRPFVEPMFSLPVGRIMLAVGAMLLTAGWGAMRMLTKVEL